jgi:hypothetical protein
VLLKENPEAYQLGDAKPTKIARTKLEPAKLTAPWPAPSGEPSVRQPRRKRKSFLIDQNRALAGFAPRVVRRLRAVAPCMNMCTFQNWWIMMVYGATSKPQRRYAAIARWFD